MQILVIILVSITLAEMMFAMGLRLSFSKLIDSVSTNRSLVFRSLLANYMIIPGITLIIIILFHVPPLVAIGLLILGVSPAAPYGPPFTAIAKGNLAIATGLMVILAGTSAFMTPLLLHLFLPVISNGDFSIRIDPLRLIGTLFIIQLLPLCMGLTLGQWWPKISSTLLTLASHISKVLNFLMIAAITILQLRVVTGIPLNTLAIMVILVSSGIITGWIFGWPGTGNRISVSIITAMRNMSLSMGIAATSFPGSPVVATVLAYSFIAGLGVLFYAFLLRWMNQ
jgi:bile acid:Na+ symporter, BASS family